MDIILIAVGWTVFLTLHSVLASGKVKKFVETEWPALHRWYRLFYTVINSLMMVLLLYWMLITPSQRLFQMSAWVQYLALVLTSWGVIVLMLSFRHISGKAFIGLKEENNSQLIREGLHGQIRHPIYAGTILVVVGMMLYVPSDVAITSGLVMLLYLPFGIYFEEQKLIKIFGDEYLNYKKEVPGIIPRLF